MTEDGAEEVRRTSVRDGRPGGAIWEISVWIVIGNKEVIMKKVGMVFAVTLFVSVAWASTAHAGAAWYKAEVIRAGPAISGTIFINLSDTDASPAFRRKWFKAADNIKKEMLATAFTAISLDLVVRIYADLDELGSPMIRSMYMRKD